MPEDSKEKPKRWMCTVCGYIAEGELPVKCPVCGAGRENFIEVK